MAYNDAVEVFRDTEYPMMKGKNIRTIQVANTNVLKREGIPRPRW